eukprot:TRINITY_DN1834_c0_g1_i1.p10 TRINITY_DN1834_c0_g1~~TRINITY_DN1834_c0_g1_i1.p10  ORF type:complete len:120 (-),score=0.75 TRINITY_DN1834_c0_g1_i1:1844-2203(-)
MFVHLVKEMPLSTFASNARPEQHQDPDGHLPPVTPNHKQQVPIAHLESRASHKRPHRAVHSTALNYQHDNPVKSVNAASLKLFQKQLPKDQGKLAALKETTFFSSDWHIPVHKQCHLSQ